MQEAHVVTQLDEEKANDIAALCDMLPMNLNFEELIVYIGMVLRVYVNDPSERILLLQVVVERIAREAELDHKGKC